MNFEHCIFSDSAKQLGEPQFLPVEVELEIKSCRSRYIDSCSNNPAQHLVIKLKYQQGAGQQHLCRTSTCMMYLCMYLCMMYLHLHDVSMDEHNYAGILSGEEADSVPEPSPRWGLDSG